MKEDVRPLYLKACEDVCEKFGREENLDHLKNEVNVGTFPEIARDLDEEIGNFFEDFPWKDKVLSTGFLKIPIWRFKLRNVIKKQEYPTHSNFPLVLKKSEAEKEINYEYIGYPEDFDLDNSYSILLHEVGHALFYSYRKPFPGVGISEAYALASQEENQPKVLQRIGEELLTGTELSDAVKNGIKTSIENEELVIRGSDNPIEEGKKLLKKNYTDLQEYHFKGTVLFNKIKKEYGEDCQKVMGDALVNPRIDFDNPNKFLEDLINSY